MLCDLDLESGQSLEDFVIHPIVDIGKFIYFYITIHKFCFHFLKQQTDGFTPRTSVFPINLFS